MILLSIIDVRLRMFNYYLDYMQSQWLLDLFKGLIVNVIITSNKLQAVMESSKVCNVVVAAVPNKWYIMASMVCLGPKVVSEHP